MKRTPILLWCLLAMGSIVALYHTSDRAQDLQSDLNHLNAQIRQEEQNLHVLKAEWAYLSSPDRVAKLAKKHFATDRAKPAQTISTAQLNKILPVGVQTQSTEAVAVASAPAMPVIGTASAPAKTAAAIEITAEKPAAKLVAKPAAKLASAKAKAKTKVAAAKKPAVKRQIIQVASTTVTTAEEPDQIRMLLNRLAAAE